MMYSWTYWLDHVTQYENRYKETNNTDGTVTHTPEEGEVLQQGTPQNATNFNKMEDGISNAGELAALMAIERIHTQQAIEDITGETLTVSLTNTLEYPFNNSVKTVALQQQRNHTDYTVTAELLDETGGFAGDIIISDKLVNGFKVAYTGSATNATVKLYVKGGFY
jgi:hypothetical protein